MVCRRGLKTGLGLYAAIFCLSEAPTGQFGDMLTQQKTRYLGGGNSLNVFYIYVYIYDY
jgi:hypothetical protein